jgi:hypothetical protein
VELESTELSRVWVRIFQLALLLGLMMLCDVISAVTELMVRIFQLALLLGFTMVSRLKPGHACDIQCHASSASLVLTD